MEKSTSAIVVHRHQPLPRDLGMRGAEGVVDAAGVSQHAALDSGVGGNGTGRGGAESGGVRGGRGRSARGGLKHGDVTVMAASPSPLARSRTPAVASIQKSSLFVRRKTDGKGSDQSGAPADG